MGVDMKKFATIAMGLCLMIIASLGMFSVDPRDAAASGPVTYTYLPLLNRNFCPVLYNDEFSNPGSGWPIVDTGDVKYGYLGGEYQVLVRSAGWFAAARPGEYFTNFFAGLQVQNINGIEGSYGIIFGIADDWSAFYTYEIDELQNYGIFIYQNGWDLLAVGSSGAINPGSGSNYLEVVRNGPLIDVYANGTFLTSISDSTLLGSKQFGVTATSYSLPNVDVRFDHFTVYPGGCSVLTRASGNPDVQDELVSNRDAGLAGTLSRPYSMDARAEPLHTLVD
jgi:hypothetical protein